MPTTLTATLKLPPSVNRSYQVRWNRGPGSKGLCLTADAREWLTHARFVLRLGKWSEHAVSDVSTARLTVRFYCSKARDIDGVKLLIDALFDAVDLNDRILTELHVTKTVCRRDEHRAEVELTLA